MFMLKSVCVAQIRTILATWCLVGSAMHVAAMPADLEPSDQDILETYQGQCGSCHGNDLGGGAFGPSLDRDAMAAKWQSRELLSAYLVDSMPPANPGSLSRGHYLRLAGLILGEAGVVTETTTLAQVESVVIGKLYLS